MSCYLPKSLVLSAEADTQKNQQSTERAEINAIKVSLELLQGASHLVISAALKIKSASAFCLAYAPGEKAQPASVRVYQLD